MLCLGTILIISSLKNHLKESLGGQQILPITEGLLFPPVEMYNTVTPKTKSTYVPKDYEVATLHKVMDTTNATYQ